MLTVNWMKCGNTPNWCPFDTLNLASITAKLGVYIIWHAGNPSRTVKVGQGIIADRLAAHRLDPTITRHRANGSLYVTWAGLQASQLDGVECYLGNQLSPLVGDRFPARVPIPVNLPWAA